MWETETKLKHNYSEDWHLKDLIKYWVSTTSCNYLCVSRKSLTRWLKRKWYSWLYSARIPKIYPWYIYVAYLICVICIFKLHYKYAKVLETWYFHKQTNHLIYHCMHLTIDFLIIGLIILWYVQSHFLEELKISNLEYHYMCYSLSIDCGSPVVFVGFFGFPYYLTWP
jgi:hypothetical protein